jgi:biotin synthase
VTNAPEYPLVEAECIHNGVAYARRNRIHRFSLVTSGRRLPKKEIGRLADAFSTIHADGMELCTSLGILDSEDFHQLKQAGVSRYHHNLETAESYFKQICTTHTYKDRIKTVIAAKDAGMRICAGGIFGVGENDKHVLALAMALRDLEVDSIPVNFLIPIPGTRLGSQKKISPLRCLKIIALLRYVLFDKEIIVCGGRVASLGKLHPLVFYAGASGIMTGDLLTASGRNPLHDHEMIKRLGLVPG